MPTAASRRVRRRLLVAAAVLPWAALRRAVAEELTPTPSQPEGPFYPRTLPPDRGADLIAVAGRPGRAEGTPLYLEGSVRSRAGAPLTAARVEIWQCDAHGRYHYVNDGGTAPIDPNFQGYGETLTDNDGRYRFRTIRPVAYTGRSPHIHFKVSHAGAVPLTTQMYVAGDPTEADRDFLRWYGRGARDQLTIVLAPAPDAEPGALHGQFDIVLATTR